MPEIGSNSALRVRHLRKSYKDVVAVDGLDLEVQAGECFGLLGPNGAGKTTTVEICEGLTAPDSGDVEVLGQRWSSNAAQLRQRLGITCRIRNSPKSSPYSKRFDCFEVFSGKERKPPK